MQKSKEKTLKSLQNSRQLIVHNPSQFSLRFNRDNLIRMEGSFYFDQFHDLNIFQMEVEKTIKDAAAAPEVKEETPVHTLLLEIKDTLTLLDKAVTNKETRTVSKITKNVKKYRNIIKAHHLIALYESLSLQVPESIRQSPGLNPEFSQKLELPKNLISRVTKTLELEGFVKILQIQILWRDERYDEGLVLVEDLLNRFTAANRRSLDNYTSVLYHRLARLHEKKGQDQILRERLLEALNRACVRSDEIGQCTIFNLLLRNYLRHSQLEAAYNLIEKCSFPEGRSNNEFCKYLYYTGKIKAVRREYSEALDMLNQAIRKSPDVAKGFKIQCQKAAIVVELLMGEIPNRQIFSDVLIFTNTYPYYQLIQVVLEGELTNFGRVVEANKQVYLKDGLYSMILRLNQIVIRIGLRKISIAYSNISLDDVAKKLNFPASDIEFVVAKALRDGILNGEIDHENKILKVQRDVNIYVTHEPQQQLDKRIRYCLGLYHQVQKAITYPDMKMNLGEFKEEQLDASQLMNLLQFDDDM